MRLSAVKVLRLPKWWILEETGKNHFWLKNSFFRRIQLFSVSSGIHYLGGLKTFTAEIVIFVVLMSSYFCQKFEGKIGSFFPRFSRLTTTRILLKVFRKNNRFINVMKMRISAVNVSAPTRLRNEEENNFSPQLRIERLPYTNPLCLRFGPVFLISLTPK